MLDENNTLLLQAELARNEASKQAPRIAALSTPPLYGPEEGLLVDPDLLSPHLNRLRIDLPQDDVPQAQELDSNPTTKLRQQVRIVRAMRSLGMRRPVRSPGIQHTSRPDPGDYPSGAAVRL